MCSVCRQYPCHPRCPNFEPEKAAHYCSVCGEGICAGDRYIENEDGEYRHFDCFLGMRELLEWLGHDVMTMRE